MGSKNIKLILADMAGLTGKYFLNLVTCVTFSSMTYFSILWQVKDTAGSNHKAVKHKKRVKVRQSNDNLRNCSILWPKKIKQVQKVKLKSSN